MKNMPNEYMVRGGFLSLSRLAERLGRAYVTVYKWAIQRRDTPEGFPVPIRMNHRWMFNWNDVLKYEDSLRKKK